MPREPEDGDNSDELITALSEFRAAIETDLAQIRTVISNIAERVECKKLADE